MIFGNQLINRQARVSQLPNIYNNDFLLLLATAENRYNINIATAMSEAVACGNWQLRNNVGNNKFLSNEPKRVASACGSKNCWWQKIVANTNKGNRNSDWQ